LRGLTNEHGDDTFNMTKDDLDRWLNEKTNKKGDRIAPTYEIFGQQACKRSKKSKRITRRRRTRKQKKINCKGLKIKLFLGFIKII
jgi:hypothetical protein